MFKNKNIFNTLFILEYKNINVYVYDNIEYLNKVYKWK